MKTYSARSRDVQRDWFVIDASGKRIGRLASEAAFRLRGKHKPVFTPHVDTGDYIVVINADKAILSGRKAEQKVYHRWTGYIGHMKHIGFNEMMATRPERVIEQAVKGMLPSNTLGRQMLKKLKVYAGSEHNHHAQAPQTLEV